jgi:putative NADPH-quinone reductase
MRLLIIYCHPCAESFTAAIRDRALAAMQTAGHTLRLRDLYAEGFNPVLSAEERCAYHTQGENEAPVAAHLQDLRWCEGLVLIFPTWWYGPPAMLKGWLDRVWVPHATFTMPTPQKPIGPVLTHIRRLVVVTTLGSPWWWWQLGMGAPGRRMVISGLRPLLSRRCRCTWLAMHRMDTAPASARDRFLARVGLVLGRP